MNRILIKVSFFSLLLVGCSFLAAPARAADSKAATKARPNFLVILCDDLGYGDLGCFGHPHIQTPNLDAFAKEGVRLTDCYSSAPVCSSSRAGLLTGRNPTRIGVYDWIPEDHQMHLQASEITIANLLQNAGYATCHVGKWHCNGKFNSNEQPQPGEHGFEYWMSTQNNAHPTHKDPDNFVINGKPAGLLKGYSCQIVAEHAIDWLKSGRDQEKPFFQFVCFHEPHEPIESPPELVSAYADVAPKPRQADYFANVTNMDRAVGRILKALKELNLEENTLVYFSSDNGPETYNRHRLAFRSHGSPGPLRGMKLHLYDGGIRVPGIMRYPQALKGGQTITDPICALDLLPTFCELAGVALPQNRTLDGASVTPLFAGEPIKRSKPLFWHYFRGLGLPKAALRDGDWMIVGLIDEATNGNIPRVSKDNVKLLKTAKLVDFQLFNVRKDISQQHDLAQAEPDRLNSLRQALREAYDESLAAGVNWPEIK